MKATRLQYFFATDWPVRFYLMVPAFYGWWLVIAVSEPTLATFRHADFALLFVACMILAPAFMAFLFLPVAWFVLGPVYYWRAHLNGAPFAVGDRVSILHGPQRDRVVEVYEVWAHRRQVRVNLDLEAQQSVSDVFSFTQVCRNGSP